MVINTIRITIDDNVQKYNSKQIHLYYGDPNDVTPEVYRISSIFLKPLFPINLPTTTNHANIRITTHVLYQHDPTRRLLEQVTEKTIHRIGNSHWYFIQFPALAFETSPLRVLFKREKTSSKYTPWLLSNDRQNEAKVMELEDQGLLCCLDEAPSEYDPDVVKELIQICNRQTHMIVALQSQVSTLMDREIKKEVDACVPVSDLANIITQY